MERVLKLHHNDNILVALQDLRKGERASLNGQDYVLVSDIPAKHKFAAEDLSAGERVVMYGVVVGRTREALRRGEIIATRNVSHSTEAFHENSAEYHWTAPNAGPWREKTFIGYHRADGQVGTRNYWLIVPLVFWENRNIDVLKQAFEEELGFSSPTIYRQQVAALARLYSAGKTEEIKRHDFQETGTAGR